MKEFQDLVTLAPWTFIFQICNLLILTAGVKHFLFVPVQKVLAKRKEQIEDTYEKAEKAEGGELETRRVGRGAGEGKSIVEFWDSI